MGIGATHEGGIYPHDVFHEYEILGEITVPPKHQHNLHDREDGLAHCKICGGAESSLPKDCPGRKLSEMEEDQITNRQLNFISGQWVRGTHPVNGDA